MSTIAVNAITDASGGSTASINGYTPTVSNMAGRNKILNGAMVIDQRNAGASFNNSNAAAYCADRWISYGLSGAVLAIQQVTDAPDGFTSSIKCTVSTTTTANDGGGFAQKIEANNCSDLSFGTANAKSTTLSFWVKSSVTGQHNMVLQYFGSSSTQYYCSAYTVNATDTWEQKTISVPACTTGGAFTGALNAQYLAVWPTTFQSSGNTTFNTADAWTSTASTKLSGAVNLASTLNATIQITGVQLEAGSVATPFEHRQYGQELALCQRYCMAYGGSNLYENIAYGIATSTTNVNTLTAVPVQMRTTPSLTVSGSCQLSDGATGFVIYVLSIAANLGGTQQVALNATSTGLTAQRTYRIETANSTASRVFFTAEL